MIGGVLGQMREAIGFEHLKEDLFEEFDIDSSVAFMKTKKGFRTFSMQERDYRAILFFRIGARLGVTATVMMTTMRSGLVYPVLGLGSRSFFFQLG